MRTNNAMQLKARVNNRAKEAGIMLEEVCKTTKTILGRLDWDDWVHT